MEERYKVEEVKGNWYLVDKRNPAYKSVTYLNKEDAEKAARAANEYMQLRVAFLRKRHGLRNNHNENGPAPAVRPLRQVQQPRPV